jgi:hypothetical protein
MRGKEVRLLTLANGHPDSKKPDFSRSANWLLYFGRFLRHFMEQTNIGVQPGKFGRTII